MDLAEERRRFEDLQRTLPSLYRRQFADRTIPRTVVVVPSLSFDADELAKISGVHHYEERMLCMLMLLRLPQTHVVYLTSQALDPSVIDYHLHLLAGVPSSHARRRLHLFDTGDASPIPLSRKLLDRPRLLQRIRSAIGDPDEAHMTCFASTELERSLAVALGIPLYACDPALLNLGSKSGSRAILREAGVDVPEGFENLRDARDVADALHRLCRCVPDAPRAVVKLNEGFSGEGNAITPLVPLRNASVDEILALLPTSLQYEAPREHWDSFSVKMEQMQGIVELFVEGDVKRSPSAQFRIDPLGVPEAVSTHDQVLGGASGQVFMGCTFPADPAYRMEIQAAGRRVAEVIGKRGVIGRFAVDFVSVPHEDGWKHYGLEINLRKGGTTHPMMVLHFLTDGRYDPSDGCFRTPQGAERYYYASDNIQSEQYRGLLPDDLIDLAVLENLHFHGATQQGVAFHLIGALSQHGKLGMVCIGDSPESADRLRARVSEVLDQATTPTAS